MLSRGPVDGGPKGRSLHLSIRRKLVTLVGVDLGKHWASDADGFERNGKIGNGTGQLTVSPGSGWQA